LISALVVPGDILILEAGRRIAADVRLLETQALQCSEMALTGFVDYISRFSLIIWKTQSLFILCFSGESEPVSKDGTYVAPPPGAGPLSRDDSSEEVLPKAGALVSSPSMLNPNSGIADIASSARVGALNLVPDLPAPHGAISPRTPRKPAQKEAALTDKNMAYMGCTVQDGRGRVSNQIIDLLRICLTESSFLCLL
jgi:magnesium-transporting ATPase (P-type)